MAKDKKQQAATNVSDEPVRSDLNFGEVDAQTEAKMTEVDPLENVPSFVPGKDGFAEGDRLVGRYLGTKRVYSDKFTAGKKDQEGRKYRDLHMFKHKKHGRYNIWSVGILGMVLARCPIGELISIEYTGLGQAIKPGQSAPHTFRFKGENLNLDTETLMATADEREMVEGARL